MIAAEAAFVESGYHGASLRQIAMRAGTTQAVLYRYFPSKAVLFEESVLEPFFQFLSELVEGWRAAEEGLSNVDLIGNFTRELYQFTTAHRGLFMALIAADAHGDEELASARHRFVDAMAGVLQQVRMDKDKRGWGDIDFEVAAPATIALILSTALLDPWIFPGGAAHPGVPRILSELVRYEVRAITGEQMPKQTTKRLRR